MSIQRLIPPSSQRRGKESAEFQLFDTATTRKIEAQALTQSQGEQSTLMQRAGYGVYRLVCALYSHAQRIWIVAGEGNNGGDALEAAVWLHRSGKQVHITWLGNPERMSPDSAQAVGAVKNAGLPLDYDIQKERVLGEIDLIIDGILGIGLDLQRPLSPEISLLIDLINQHPAKVVAVDVPSGLLSDSGATHANCVRANTTLTFLCAKTGLFTADGRAYCGETWLDTLNIAPFEFSAQAYLYTPEIHQTSFQSRAHNTHKGSFGDVCVIGGESGMQGAIILAARAAAKAGAGRVYATSLAAKGSVFLRLDINAPELMFRNIEDIQFHLNTIACGCGAGRAVVKYLPKILAQCPCLLLDADALNAIAEHTHLQQALKNRAEQQFLTVITPHPLEAARLLNSSTQEVQGNRLYSAQALAQEFGCTCVLKGSGSITATKGYLPIINSSGNAALATAGAGDVLAGWITGAWSAAKQSQIDLHTLVAHAVWQHGLAADRWASHGHGNALVASQIVNYL